MGRSYRLDRLTVEKSMPATSITKSAAPTEINIEGKERPIEKDSGALGTQHK
jgi:hypothetical protein